LLIAVVTSGTEGLDDVLPEFCGQAPYVTLVEVIDDKVRVKEVIKNPSQDFSYGKGPILVKELKERGVDALICPEMGYSVKKLLMEQGISFFLIDKGTKVRDAVDIFLRKFRS